MKTNRFYILLVTLMVCTSSVFVACSNDDDDNASSKELGDKAVAELQTRLIDEDGAIVFGEPNDNGFYEIGLESQNDAQKLVTQYAKGYAGTATYTYTLPDTRGTVRVDKGEEVGVFYNVKFDVKGIPQMKLQVSDINYMDGENIIKAITSYKCNNCGSQFKLPNMAAKICPSCGSSNVVKQ
ncbi:MAG: zinc ribbon domain-containing protein [Bacteroidaceae bacterium]|nr:zinc ribbon domain-containing protein [Bacteroidaceae bacterium]